MKLAKIENVRYGALGKIEFEYGARTIVIKEPSDVILVGVDANAAHRWIVAHYGFLLMHLEVTR